MDQKHLFGLIRFSVPTNWSDRAIDNLVTRIFAEEPDDRIMPSGLTHNERKEFHRTFEGKSNNAR